MLNIHPDETKSLTKMSSNKQGIIHIDDIQVAILTHEGETHVLGQMISFKSQETMEINYRIRRARSAFVRNRRESTSKSYLLKHRLRPFNSVVTPKMMYGAATWALGKGHENMMRTTQRRMLRLIIQTKRRYTSIKKETRRDKM